MLITRKTKVPKAWAFYAQLIIVLSVYGGFVINAPFLLLIKRFIDNPAAIMGLISIEVYVTMLGGPFVAWMSDRIWTRWGRRLPFIVSSELLRVFFLLGMPLAPNLWCLIILRWLYGVFGDMGSPSQPLVWEIVPSKQRGMSSGFMKAYMNVGNLVFFTMLLGRFDDIYFLGPFSYLTEVSGGAIMFWLAAMLFLGAAWFEAFGIKETYPCGRARWRDGRRPGEKPFWHFLRSIFKDVFAKDLLPLYLLLFANVMFAFGLGVFQPLLFTEQWGYDLQTFGNTIAIGVPLGIALGLLGGWVADRYGKMLIVFWMTVGNLVVNIIYTLYVWTLPDYRPSFWEIVLFGNLAYIFGGIKGVVSGPLLWEFVGRNRMGSATGGIILFNTIFRNSVALFVGLWLLWWSIWFYPQAGYNLTATFREELDEPTVARKLEDSGLDLHDFKLRPVHQYGVDGETSRRWWIHREDAVVQDYFKEKEQIEERLQKLNRQKISVLTPQSRLPNIEKEIEAGEARLQVIDQTLDDLAAELEAALVPALESKRFVPGEQLLDASWENGRLELAVSTIEELPEKHRETLMKNLQGPDFALKREVQSDGRPRWVSDIEIQSWPAATGHLPSVRLVARMDQRFCAVFHQAYQAGLPEPQAYALATALISATTGLFGREPDDYTVELSSSPSQEIAIPTFSFSLRVEDTRRPALTSEKLGEALQEADAMLEGAEVEAIGDNRYRIDLRVPIRPVAKEDLRYDEVMPALQRKLPAGESECALAKSVLRKLAETLAATPIYVTVPRYAIQPGAAKRQYEYFFSSQLLQMSTDVLGIGVLLLILALERKGVLHRAGAEEDKNR